MADSIPNTSRISFASAGAVRARPSVALPDDPVPVLPTKPMPLVQRLGNGFVPVIYHPERTTEYTRFERLIRKSKATPAEALRHAERVIWYRQRRANEKRRREELRSPRFFLEAAE